MWPRARCSPVPTRSFGGIGVFAIPEMGRFYRHVLIEQALSPPRRGGLPPCGQGAVRGVQVPGHSGHRLQPARVAALSHGESVCLIDPAGLVAARSRLCGGGRFFLMEAEGRSWDFWEGGVCRVSCALWALATLAFCAAAQVFGAPEGSVSPVGCWARGPKRPGGAPKGSVCPVGTWARGPKRPEGVSKYKGCARPAHRTPIFARERNHARAGGKRVPCGHLGQRPKATRRREQIQGLRAASAQNADICERQESAHD